jgi:protein involved in polysaccharide export with SLBB domain
MPSTNLSIAVLASLLFVAPATAQATAPDSPARVALRARLAAAESLATAQPTAPHRAAVERIRQRLAAGDFRAGDRVIVRVQGLGFARDTFVVQAGPALRLPDLPELPLAGVLFAELQPHLAARIGNYVREPVVEAIALVRVAVSGEVSRPGFYYLQPDLPLSEAIMAAAPSTEADLQRGVVRRGAETLLERDAVSAALRAGRTLDDLDVHAGDELVVGRRRRPLGWTAAVQAATALAGIVAIVLTVGRN